jgi:hypothetical protein
MSAAFGEAEDGGLLRPSGIHDCTDSATWGLAVGKTDERHWIRYARFAPVPPLRIVSWLNRRRYRRLDEAVLPAG